MPYAVNQGIRIFYEVAGEGPVVVLMHGIGDTSEIWHRLGAVERLATKFTVVTIDARGLGESDHPTEPAAYVRQLRRDDTVAVLDAISADQAHLVGYSLGGRNALYVSTAHPERVASVVAIAANPFPTPMNLQLTAHLRRGRPIYLRALGKLRRTMMGFVRGRSVGELIDAAGSEAFDVDEAIAAMTMPVYLLTGEFDERFAVELTKI